jgi:hypothetical protein
MVWPSKFKATQNYYGEEARFDIDTSVVASKMCSNGIVYGVNNVQATDVFYTLLGEIALDPQYSLMYQGLKSLNMHYLIKNPILKLQIILLNNDQIQSLGLNYNYGTSVWEFSGTYDGSLGSSPTTALERILNLHILLDKNVDFTKRGYIETYGGEFVRYQYVSPSFGTTIYGPGKTTPRIKFFSTNTNGIAYVINPSVGQVGTPITYNTDNVGARIEGSATSTFGEFYRYLDKSAKSISAGSDPPVTMNGFIYDINTKAITGVKITENTTILVPSNTAMKQAVTDGYLPAITSLDFTQLEQEKVQKFINYHILSKIVLVPDGNYNGQAATHYSTQEGVVYVNVVNTAATNTTTSYGTVEIFDAQGRVAKSTSTVPTLSNRSIIIPLDNYLRYE